MGNNFDQHRTDFREPKMTKRLGLAIRYTEPIEDIEETAKRWPRWLKACQDADFDTDGISLTLEHLSSGSVAHFDVCCDVSCYEGEDEASERDIQAMVSMYFHVADFTDVDIDIETEWNDGNS